MLFLWHTSPANNYDVGETMSTCATPWLLEFKLKKICIEIDGSISSHICKLVSSISSRTLRTVPWAFWHHITMVMKNLTSVCQQWWSDFNGSYTNVYLMYGKSISCVSVTMVTASTSCLCLRERGEQMMEKRKRK